jgi:flagellin
MISVVNNIFSLNTQRQLSQNQMSLGTSLERLSSGLRVNSAKDDAAALAISSQMKADLLSMNQALRNTNDGVSLLSVAEGALVEVGSMLQRMRELSIESSTATIASSQRASINQEFTALKTEIDRISLVTNFNGQGLLNGALNSAAATQLSVQVGIQNDSVSQININRSVNLTNLDTTALNVATSTITSAGSAQSALSFIDSALAVVNTARGNIGAVQNRLTRTISNLNIGIENMTAADSRLVDADMASEISKFTRTQIMVQASTSMLAQANLVPQSVLSLLK